MKRIFLPAIALALGTALAIPASAAIDEPVQAIQPIGSPATVTEGRFVTSPQPGRRADVAFDRITASPRVVTRVGNGAWTSQPGIAINYAPTHPVTLVKIPVPAQASVGTSLDVRLTDDEGEVIGTASDVLAPPLRALHAGSMSHRPSPGETVQVTFAGNPETPFRMEISADGSEHAATTPAGSQGVIAGGQVAVQVSADEQPGTRLVLHLIDELGSVYGVADTVVKSRSRARSSVDTPGQEKDPAARKPGSRSDGAPTPVAPVATTPAKLPRGGV